MRSGQAHRTLRREHPCARVDRARAEPEAALAAAEAPIRPPTGAAGSLARTLSSRSWPVTAPRSKSTDRMRGDAWAQGTAQSPSVAVTRAAVSVDLGLHRASLPPATQESYQAERVPASKPGGGRADILKRPWCGP